MTINNPTFVPRIFHPDVRVYNAVAPIAWTDLDLSAVVGARRCTVLLNIINDGGAGASQTTWRTNGNTRVINDGVGKGGNLADGEDCSVLVETDAAGIVEWIASAVGHDIYVTAYYV